MPGDSPMIILNFDEELPLDLNFQTSVCQFLESEVMYDDPTSSFTFIQNITVGGIECEFMSPEAEFEDIYFDFFENEVGNPFSYEITKNNGVYQLVIQSQSGNVATYSSQLLNISTVELEEITIYPTLVSNEIGVYSTHHSIQKVDFYTIEGNLLEEFYFSNIPYHKLDISHFPIGIYALNVQCNHGHLIKKIVKR